MTARTVAARTPLGGKPEVHFVGAAFAGKFTGSDLDVLRGVITRSLGSRSSALRTRDTSLLVYAELKTGEDPVELVDDIRSRAAAELNDETLSAGVGSVQRSTAGAHVALLEAEHSLMLGRALAGEGHTVNFQDLGPYSFILGRPPRSIREFYERMLGALADRDLDDGETLLRTLELYIRLANNSSFVARELGIHRNTVHQRLRRIAGLTGADLRDPDVRLALYMAILARRALGKMTRRSSSVARPSSVGGEADDIAPDRLAGPQSSLRGVARGGRGRSYLSS